MQSRRILLIRGLSELEKLESTGATQIFKYVVEQCKIVLGPRKPVVMHIKDENAPTAIVRGTTHMVAICQLTAGETAPAHLPRVNWAYI